jgi:hypothetical protein
MVKPYLTRPVQDKTTKYKPYCIKCSMVPAEEEALFRIKGAIIIEKYCSACVKTATYRL